jgi:1,4-dihydroxy-2-naphthoate octaprenyltransferase
MIAWRAWIEACRPKTLVAALVPVAVGGAVYINYADVEHFGRKSDYYLTFGACLAFAVFAQIVSNFANDLGDSKKGVDNAARVGPQRAVANGLISAKAMTYGVLAAIILACLGGLPIGLREPTLFIPGTIALLLALAYTLGPLPLSYLGLGDVFVVACFGVQATALTVYALHVMVGRSAQLAMPWAPALVAGLGLGLLADNILLANNARDLETDEASGKQTTVVRFGRGFARSLHIFNLLGGIAALALVFGWLLLLLLPLAIWQHAAFRRAQAPADFVPFLGRSALLLLLAGALCVTATCLDWVPVGIVFSR